MKQQYFKYFLILGLLGICLFQRVQAQDIQASVTLDRHDIKIGEQVKLQFSVRQPKNVKVSFPQITDSLIAKVQLVGKNKPDTTVDQYDKTRVVVHQDYIITSFDEGTYTLPSYAFASGTDTSKTNELILQVHTVKVDTTKAFYDIKQPLAVSYTLWDWLRDHWVAVLITLAIILLIIGVIWYIKTRPKKEVVVEEVKPDVPIHVIAIDKLNELRGKKLWQQGEFKIYYSEISDIIREYLEKRYVIKTYEKTTDEIFASLRHLEITEENRGLLRQLLVLSDLVKFAKEKPLPAENEQSLDNAIAFVSNTRQVMVQPAHPTEGGKE